jgi:hypothetical protein
MANAILSLEQGAVLVARMKAAAEGKGRFSEVVMPNGHELKDCTLDYVAEIAEAMQVMGFGGPKTFGWA